MENNQEIELGEIRQKTIYGFLWEFSSKFLEFFVSFIGGLILVRILEPYDYGIIALTYIFIRLAGVLTEGGFSRYIVQNKDADEIDYSTALLANFSIASILYSIIFIAAPFIADFYKEPNLILLLRVVSLSIIFHSLNIIHLTRLHLDLNFRFTSLINITSQILSIIIAIVLAYFRFGYWALVALSLTPSIVAVIYLWFFSGIKIKFVFSLERFKKMLNFGKSIIPLDILGIFSLDIYTNMIGKIESTNTVGIYNRAVQTHGYVTMFVKFPLAKIMNPVFRKIQDNMELVRDTIIRVFEMTFYINIPLLILLSVFAEEIFIVLYTAKWLDSVWMFQVLSIGAIISPMNITLSYVLISIGQSKLFFKVEWTVKILQFIIILIFISSIELMLTGLVVFEFVQVIVRLYHYKRYLKFDIKTMLDRLRTYAILSIMLLIVNVGLKKIDLTMNIYFELTIVLLVNSITVALYGKAQRLRPYNDIRDFMLEFAFGIKQKLKI